ncbi:MAG: hypothetical protein KC619_28800, partial [Myxococcales bacterium]|nr:hypothetical protein [Myxococcales bacterium]
MSFVRLLLALSTITAMTAPSSASRPPAHSTTPWTLEIERFQHDHAAGGPVHAVTCTLRGRAATTIRCDEGTSITLDPVESAWFRDAVQAVDWRATPPARADVGGWRLRHRRPGVRAALTVYDATDVAPAVDRVI